MRVGTVTCAPIDICIGRVVDNVVWGGCVRLWDLFTGWHLIHVHFSQQGVWAWGRVCGISFICPLWCISCDWFWHLMVVEDA